MKVKLLKCDDLTHIDSALGMCWNKGCYIEPMKRDKRIKNNALKLKHESVLEFCNIIFEVEASTKVLLEATRHRIGVSFACRSSRYTLNKLEVEFEKTNNKEIDYELEKYKRVIEKYIKKGVSNDIVSLMLPQAYMYKWQMQFNMRSLKHFIELRDSKSAHFHIRELAQAMYQEIPKDMKYILKEK